MRITQEAKEKTKKTILEVAEKLFAERGFEQTTTRDISAASGIAKGTLFNYFKSKETLAMTLVNGAMESGRKQYERRKTGEEGLVEELFLFVASELRALKPFRKYIGPVLESCMSVFSKKSICPAGEEAKHNHLKTVGQILANHGFEMEYDSIVITLYWSLYLGILAHWSNDDTHNQAETLGLIDYSMQTFANTISANSGVEQAVSNE
ncbi:transcriptional regulator [Desulfocapsa sulfexigens DSM 10523]|uniref:Transcriptional regulator n=1 Tax=Desulfocapsa sulfexigens (strain DSM 10523 / SB164P1) TaxID=1167006 RepID=M1PMW6_DESSD|nr:TetR/AcrR family transcriptional regulator [Desulfocapsa sulfexigens]AGF77786.1 transcriptional regulator [Desulfocapsa sulfexigens DSM 10523]